MDDPGRAGSAANSGIKSGAEVFAAIPIFIAVSNAKATQNVNIFLDELAAGTPLNELLVNPPKPMTLYEYVTVLAYNSATTTEEKEDIRRRFANTDPRNSELYKFGAEIMDYLDKKLETNPKYADEFFADILPEAIGNLAGKGLLSAALISLGVPPLAAGAMIGAANESSKRFRETLYGEKSIDEAYREFGFGALFGLAEGLPLAEMLARADKVSGGTITDLLKDAAIKGTEEAVKEVIKKSRDILHDKGIADNQELAAVFTVEAIKEFGIGLLGAK